MDTYQRASEILNDDPASAAWWDCKHACAVLANERGDVLFVPLDVPMSAGDKQIAREKGLWCVGVFALAADGTAIRVPDRPCPETWQILADSEPAFRDWARTPRPTLAWLERLYALEDPRT